MSKGMKAPAPGKGRMDDLLTTEKSDTWKQRLGIETKIQKPKLDEEIERLQEQLNEKNSYLSQYKTNKFAENTIYKSDFVYDMLKKDEEDNSYCIKCKRESAWCPHKRPREVPKETMAMPATSGQSVGWKQPIDHYRYGTEKNSVCKNTFYNGGHLS